MIKVPVGNFQMGEREKKAINEVLDSGRISEGFKVKEFEQQWGRFIGTKYSSAMSSGTSALIAGLTALKYYDDLEIKPGTKVITTPITYISTTNAVVLSNFEPVFVDISQENFCITPENIKGHLEEIDDPTEYSIVLPVHLMGFPCDMDPINKIASKYGLVTFEDSAQAHGTLYKGKRTGSLSLLSAFSFYIAHNIQAGELGAINTNDPEMIRLIRKIKTNGRMCDCAVCLRNEGKCPHLKKSFSEDDFDPRFAHDLIGYNFKAMEFQAALAITQLDKVQEIITKRLENVKYLNENLEKFSDIIQIPAYDKNISYLAYPIILKNPEKISRKKIRLELEKNGVETRPLFGSIPTQQIAYHGLKKKYSGKIPNADYVGENAFYIGCHQYLEENDLEYVVAVFNEILKDLK
jgi:dTDP-4-amino-4,6-dideoxygalactose transaminase